MSPSARLLAVLACVLPAAIAAPAPVIKTSPQLGSPFNSPCHSLLYCPGDFLKEIQLTYGRVNDSKAFVDMPSKKPAAEILQLWAQQKDKSYEAVASFLEANFGNPGDDIVQAQLDSTVKTPEWITSLANKFIAGFVDQAFNYWSSLLRVYKKPDYFCDECETSAIPLPYPGIVAGARFRETYYWDSYFTILGLLLSGYTEQAWNQLQNFMFLIDQYGFIPNGARAYYSNRSQPPLFCEMVYAYYSFTTDTNFLAQAFPYIEREMEFWRTNTTVDITVNNKVHTLNRYVVYSSDPRPESYKEDFDCANNKTFYWPNNTLFMDNVPVLTDIEKTDLYAELATTAETGMDFSSRFLNSPFRQGTNAWVLRTLTTRSIIPVDLNAILYKAEMRLSNFAALLGIPEKQKSWCSIAELRNTAMNALLYDDFEKIYHDYNYEENAQIRRYAVSSWTVDWAGIIRPSGKPSPSDLDTIWAPIKRRTEEYVGGLPTTDIESGLQWDKSNVWAPNVCFVIMGLLDTKNDALLTLALQVAQDFIDAAFCSWIDTQGDPAKSFQSTPGSQAAVNGDFFEKYNAENINIAGGGGEYGVQIGFAWTNGFILWLVHQFGDKLQAATCSTPVPGRGYRKI
ncbi:Trehalase [Neolecta irregularis DAH-3]|uniref:Trehalase n=1 Tax=Neolecta irregularis (strain DAH-3) TaxID=1198029 RepID=A0A1U7LTP0_NEOID|nr:Trehalase [Neolecta irregularis DAH-3]|eukprot:OLL25912.1 Trehalase [Neolecta irregularis DAH-3]